MTTDPQSIFDLERTAIAQHLSKQLVDELRSILDSAKLAEQLIAELTKQREQWKSDELKELGMHLDLLRTQMELVEDLNTFDRDGTPSNAIASALNFYDHAADLLDKARGTAYETLELARAGG